MVNQNGFSLVELIIIMVIVTLLSTGAAVAFSYRGLVSRQDAALLQLTFNLRKIQNFALTGLVDDNNIVPSAYGIYLESSEQYLIFRDINGNFVYDQDDTVIERTVVGQDIRLSPIESAIVSIVPTGLFCYDTDNVSGGEDCNSESILSVGIEGSTVTKDIVVDHISGKISNQENNE